MKDALKRLLKRPFFVRLARRVLELQDWFIIPTTEGQKEVVRLIKRIKNETRMALNNQEAYQIYVTVKQTAKVPGAIAEVGVFKGGSARLITEIMGDKKLYLFDTYEGLPAIAKIDEGYFYEGQFPTDFEKVKSLFVGKNVELAKGLFPQETGKTVENERFSLVHLDVDLYESTRDCLEFFYPRMNRGGVIISHDYVIVPAVRKAFDEFFKDKPEVILEPSWSQALVVKV